MEYHKQRKDSKSCQAPGWAVLLAAIYFVFYSKYNET